MKPHFQTLRCGAFTILVAVFLSGCGDGGGGPTSVTTSASTQAASPVEHAEPDISAKSEDRTAETVGAKDTDDESANTTEPSSSPIEHNYGRVTADDGVHAEP
ncbi:hypothetical protein [Paraburkholderia tropica]|uniref:hypothetical protein n=1 Tax=Paraburkholderia tropica TaxID=92647 RepID=UPI0015921004|nr:hypothetical protein [Paraburkholderia tropica]MBB2999448.1 hypothetical protein [Paraburkholderia tropica]MBB6317904.1 hypothetical protein [Paraburkholderia tropica]